VSFENYTARLEIMMRQNDLILKFKNKLKHKQIICKVKYFHQFCYTFTAVILNAWQRPQGL
jgi:hypothetical protein